MNVKVTGDSGEVGKVLKNFLMESLPPPRSIKIMMTSVSTPIRARAVNRSSPYVVRPRSIFFRMTSSETDSSESVVIFWSRSQIFTLISSCELIPSHRATRKQKGRPAYSGVAGLPSSSELLPGLTAAKLLEGLKKINRSDPLYRRKNAFWNSCVKMGRDLTGRGIKKGGS